MVWELDLVKNGTRLQSEPFLFLNHVPTWDVSKLYNWKVEQPPSE